MLVKTIRYFLLYDRNVNKNGKKTGKDDGKDQELLLACLLGHSGLLRGFLAVSIILIHAITTNEEKASEEG